MGWMLYWQTKSSPKLVSLLTIASKRFSGCSVGKAYQLIIILFNESVDGLLEAKINKLNKKKKLKAITNYLARPFTNIQS